VQSASVLGMNYPSKSLLRRSGAIVVLAALLLLTLTPFAVAQTAPETTSATPRTTYFEVVRQFKSVTCPGESLEACTSGPSEQLKTIIRERVDAGWTKEAIVKSVEDEFGDRILSATPRKGINWWLWILPVVFIAGGAVAAGRLMRTRAATVAVTDPGQLPADLAPYVADIERAVKEDE